MAGRNEILHVELVEIGAIILKSYRAASSSVGKSQIIMGFGVHPRKIPHMTPGSTDKAAYCSNVYNKRKQGERLNGHQ